MKTEHPIKNMQDLEKEIERLDRAVFEKKIALKQELENYPKTIGGHLLSFIKSAFLKRFSKLFL